MKKKVLIGACIALVVILIAGTTLIRNFKPTMRTLNAAQVTKEEIGEEVYASGRLELSDKTEVSAPFSAKVKSVSVKLGDQVQAGQVLFELDSEDLQKQLANSKLDLAGAQANLNETNKARESNIADANSTLDKAQKQLDQAKVIGGEALNAAQAAYDQAKQVYDKTVNAPTGTAQLENNIKKLQSGIADLQKQINSAVVKAPVAGTVVELNAVAGSGSSAGGMSGGDISGLSAGNMGGSSLGTGSLVTIASLDRLKARVKVNEMDSTRVQAGQKVKVTCDAVSKDYSGAVDSVSPVAVTSTGSRGEETTVEVMISLENSTGLKPGYNINASIQVADSPNSLLVPVEAVMDKDGKKVVFVADNDTLRIQEVSVGITGEQKLQLTSGVKEGEKVILNPTPNLNEGDKVKVNVQ